MSAWIKQALKGLLTVMLIRAAFKILQIGQAGS